MVVKSSDNDSGGLMAAAKNRMDEQGKPKEQRARQGK